MEKVNKNIALQPFGRMLSIIGKDYLHLINLKLNKLDIERNYYALVLIEKAEENITQQELAGMLDIDKVTMLRSIDYLSEKGYVDRVRSTTDKRKYSLIITDKARKVLPEIKNSFNEINNIALNGLSPLQITELYSVLNSIKSNITNYTSSL